MCYTSYSQKKPSEADHYDFKFVGDVPKSQPHSIPIEHKTSGREDVFCHETMYICFIAKKHTNI